MKKDYFRIIIASFIFIFFFFPSFPQENNYSHQYQNLKHDLMKGWNTWNNNSVLSHVLLPECFALNLCLKSTDITNKYYLKETYKTLNKGRDEQIIFGNRSYDGTYTELILKWKGTELLVQSSIDKNDLLLLVTPLKLPLDPPHLILESGLLWNKSGNIDLDESKTSIIAKLDSSIVKASITAKIIPNYIPASAPYLAMELKGPIGIFTGEKKSLEYIKTFINEKKNHQDKQSNKYGNLNNTYNALHNVLAWNTIYDPSQNRVITPVSRYWNSIFGGYVLFDWDNYFASYMFSLDSKALAFANAIEITKSKTPSGFIPNYSRAYGRKSFDRSQPPVGSFVVKEIYKRYPEKWFLEEVYNDLLIWNRWWPKERDNKGLLSFGSDSTGRPDADRHEHTWQAAAYESGLDNSPMYDQVPFNKKTEMLELADVGLTSLYIFDCDALVEIADILNKTKDAKELRKRAAFYRENLEKLWVKNNAFYLNKRTDTQTFSERLSPTLFYPMLAKVPSQKQAKEMIDKHYFNEEEFYGDWIMPSIARNDSAFKDQNYWRGRIWAPLNFLVYLGMKNYNVPEAKNDLVRKSNELLLKSWLTKNTVHENYNGITGEGDDGPSSDSFYHWGALLGFMALLEAGY